MKKKWTWPQWIFWIAVSFIVAVAVIYLVVSCQAAIPKPIGDTESPCITYRLEVVCDGEDFFLEARVNEHQAGSALVGSRFMCALTYSGCDGKSNIVNYPCGCVVRVDAEQVEVDLGR